MKTGKKLILLLSILLVGCMIKKPNSDRLIGRWNIANDPEQTFELTFHEDGEGHYTTPEFPWDFKWTRSENDSYATLHLRYSSFIEGHDREDDRYEYYMPMIMGRLYLRPEGSDGEFEKWEKDVNNDWYYYTLQ